MRTYITHTSVYELLYRTRPFYVGLALDPLGRFRRHLRAMKNLDNTQDVYELMRELSDTWMADYQDPEWGYQILYEKIPVGEAIKIEQRIIADNPDYANMSPGGSYHGGLRGEDIGNSILTEDIVLEIRDYCELHPGYTIERIWRELGLTEMIALRTCQAVLNHESWKHVGGYKRLNEWERAEVICQMKENGYTNNQLAEYWSMSAKSIRRILRGERGQKHRWSDRK